MSLQQYRHKRDFGKTPEPRGKKARGAARALRFVVQKHAARSLHYDFRLELDGTLKSWAIPKGPSLDPADKRLAVQVEDHPLEYGEFEGVIPEKQYGAGAVALWDCGTWEPGGDPRRDYRDGHLKFRLNGKKLHGGWALVRMKGRASAGKEPWLLIKERDDAARPGHGVELIEQHPESVKTRRTIEDIAAGRKKPAARAPATAPRPRRARPAQNAVVAGIEITHPERMLYPEAGVTKLDVARYYEAIASRMLPYIRRRPLSVVRCPDGPSGTCFFQKHATAREIPGIETTLITESGGRRPYIIANTVEALVGLAQMNALELHAWGAMAGAIERPDTLILDLDPDPALEWSKVVAGAKLTRALLDELKLKSLVKTTGGKGLHVVVPLQPRHSWDEVRSFAQAIANHLARTLPDQFTATMVKTRRRGKIFVDYLRNGRGATAVAPYSLRARPGATVATPLAWEEVTPRLKPASFNLSSVLRRIDRDKDPWAGYGKLRQPLTAAVRRALKA